VRVLGSRDRMPISVPLWRRAKGDEGDLVDFLTPHLPP